MESRLAPIRDADRTLLQDAGINALYCAFGFIEWYESETFETALYAPLLFYPIEIDWNLQHGEYIYEIHGRDDDVEPNITFGELLKRDFGLELPPWTPDATLAGYFSRVKRLISRQHRWGLRRWLTCGLFTFSKLVMYRDLAPAGWPIDRRLDVHPILQDLLAGTEMMNDVPLAEDYSVDSSSVTDRDLPLVVRLQDL